MKWNDPYYPAYLSKSIKVECKGLTKSAPIIKLLDQYLVKKLLKVGF